VFFFCGVFFGEAGRGRKPEEGPSSQHSRPWGTQARLNEGGIAGKSTSAELRWQGEKVAHKVSPMWRSKDEVAAR